MNALLPTRCWEPGFTLAKWHRNQTSAAGISGSSLNSNSGEGFSTPVYAAKIDKNTVINVVFLGRVISCDSQMQPNQRFPRRNNPCVLSSRTVPELW